MPIRFCPECGTKALAGAKFCSECGARLAGGAVAHARGESSWRITGVGAGALGCFLVAGLAIWTMILSPAPPRPAPGGGGAPRAGAATASEPASTQALPDGHPKTRVELPAEVKTFIADLDTKAKQKPKDVDAWVKLALVNSRAAQLDPSYSDAAFAAFQHVLELDPKNADALRGMAEIHYDRDEHGEAIPFFERYLALRPEDASARTDLGTMYLYNGDPTRAVATYKETIRRNPAFLQAHYNLAVAYHRQGDTPAALTELTTARGLATEDEVRKQIDDMIASLKSGRPPGGGGAPPGAAAGEAATPGPRTPFQSAVEEAFKAHPIMGPKIVRFEWTAPAAGRVFMQDFPIQGMPPAVREKFAAHLGQQLRDAQDAHHVEGPVHLDIVDVATGTPMATVTP
jgi:cytochrome c-type biogenesis protein CcmH/NrfG